MSPSPHGSPDRWRTGCRCTPCRKAHNKDTALERRELRSIEFASPERSEFLELLRQGLRPIEAAEQMGLTYQLIYGRRAWDATFATEMDDALITGRDPALHHGTNAGVKKKCACPECRAVHHPRQQT